MNGNRFQNTVGNPLTKPVKFFVHPNNMLPATCVPLDSQRAYKINAIASVSVYWMLAYGLSLGCLSVPISLLLHVVAK